MKLRVFLRNTIPNGEKKRGVDFFALAHCFKLLLVFRLLRQTDHGAKFLQDLISMTRLVRREFSRGIYHMKIDGESGDTPLITAIKAGKMARVAKLIHKNKRYISWTNFTGTNAEALIAQRISSSAHEPESQGWMELLENLREKEVRNL